MRGKQSYDQPIYITLLRESLHRNTVVSSYSVPSEHASHFPDIHPTNAFPAVIHLYAHSSEIPPKGML